MDVYLHAILTHCSLCITLYEELSDRTRLVEALLKPTTEHTTFDVSNRLVVFDNYYCSYEVLLMCFQVFGYYAVRFRFLSSMLPHSA